MPSLASQVPGFCKEVCQKLACCPYLFGPLRVGEDCPTACTTRPKSHFSAEGEADRRLGRRGRRGRKRVKVRRNELQWSLDLYGLFSLRRRRE